MVVSGYYDCFSALLKYRSYQKKISAIALYSWVCEQYNVEVLLNQN